MAYISLLALFMTVTNFVPICAIGFVPLLLLAWRFYGRSYPAFITPLIAFTVLAIVSTLLYDPHSFVDFEFYRRDGNFFVSYAPIFAGCVYAHRWDLNKVMRALFIFAVAINLPMYAYYIADNGLFSIFAHPADSFGSYFIARNAAGGFLAMLFCLGVACYLQKRSKLLIALLALNALMLFSTYSRGSLLGAAAVLPYLYFGRKRWILGTLIAALLLASLAIAIYHTESNVDYMGYTFAIHANDAKVNNLNIRYEWLWPRALAYFEQSPLVGLGFGSFDDHIGSLTSYFHLFAVPSDMVIEHSDSHAHNSYLNILAELGVVGLTLILAFFWRLIEWSKQGAAYAALVEGGRQFAAFRFVEISSVCLLVMSATEHRLVTPSNVLILSLVISLLLAARPLALSAFRPGARGAREAGIVGTRATQPQPVPQRPTQGVTSAR
ncbi:O-antigen ligase family protein [Paraburkholderia sprentiae WSM5005]|uniref:O-antigen ligase family protein n=1 Tax=Paraburkholderia sprentiae WSM5005 TaxID=754502 RepID=A0A1I9YMP0_9BURK|nr:O-antigen ligase family protein [Paraburkholderia sprentiae]APA87573.1 O-antigen ligase family protein [Paraburkholderia sprentiae WSM5005]